MLASKATARDLKVACGVDVVDVAGFERAVSLRGNHFLRRVFTDQELHITGGNTERLAARFAAKEAVGKALGTGLGDPREIEVRSGESGRPLVHLRGYASARARAQGITEWTLSMSHIRTTAIAFAVALRSGPNVAASGRSA